MALPTVSSGDPITSAAWNNMIAEIDKKLDKSGGAMTGPLSIGPSTNLNFGSQARQMINLWGTEYGIGVQGATQYYRTGSNFAWYSGGTHSDTPLNPGGGNKLMTLTAAGDLSLLGVLSLSDLTLGGALRLSGSQTMFVSRVVNDLRVTMAHSPAFVLVGQPFFQPYNFSVGHLADQGVVIGGGGVTTIFDSKFRVASTGDIFAERSINGTGADYAELFESEDGKSVPVGTSVALTKDGKVRPAKKEEIPFGIISAQPGVIGNSPMAWPERYLRDDFGSIVMEETERDVMRTKKKILTEEDPETGKTQTREVEVLDEKNQPVLEPTGAKQKVTVPKINPKYDPNQVYIPRNDREEWQKVGLIGQLRLRKGQPVAPNWIKIKDISPEVELWLIK